MQEPVLPSTQLPPIPGKRYFTIGEVSELCAVKAHTVRNWEREFPALKPMKRRGNRRYYQQNDVLLIRRIRSLLYEQGYTMIGARQKLLEEEALNKILPESFTFAVNDTAAIVQELEKILHWLK